MREIPLTRGYVAIVDACDYERLTAMGSWLYHNGYAKRNERLANGQRRTVFLHRLIMEAPEGSQVDHINWNRLDNRRSNLRLASPAQNQRNRSGAQSNSRLGIRGVSWNRRQQRWRAFIGLGGSPEYLGSFRDPHTAREAYARAAIKHFGEFASPNGPGFISPLRVAQIQFPVPIATVPGLILAPVAKPHASKILWGTE